VWRTRSQLELAAVKYFSTIRTQNPVSLAPGPPYSKFVFGQCWRSQTQVRWAIGYWAIAGASAHDREAEPVSTVRLRRDGAVIEVTLVLLVRVRRVGALTGARAFTR
jgi:hypothetical protein